MSEQKPSSFTVVEWAEILKTARAALDLPHADRSSFVLEKLNDARIAEETFKVMQELEYPETEDPGRLTTVVGRFQLLDYLGSGAFGEVYSARDPDLLRTVAIKILKPNAGSIHELEERFIYEARAVSALNHPNIVTVHEMVRMETTLAIVMELVAGETLRRKIAGPLETDELIGIGVQMAEGLSAAHAAGITHRDIKPENVMVTPDGRVKLLDFGLAKSSGFGLDSESRTSLRAGWAGTPRYMPPEVFYNKTLNAKSDIFSMGLVLYEGATGQYPFPPGSVFEVLHSIASTELDPPSASNLRVPSTLDQLILAMLHKDAAERPSAENVCQALKDIHSQRYAFAAVERFNGQTVENAKPPRRAWLWGAVSLCIALITGLAIWAELKSPNRARELRVLPLDGNAGIESGPVFLTDGKQIAYSWDGNRRNFDIYVKPVEGGFPHRLTDNASHDIDPSWSPDGQQIALLRVSPKKTDVVIIPSSGGIERVLPNPGVKLSWEPEGPADGAAAGPQWLRDGKSLIVPRMVEPSGLQRLTLDGHIESLTHAPSGTYDSSVAVSPSGRSVAFKRVWASGSSDVYVLPSRGGQPARVTSVGRDIAGIAWLDDDTIIYSSDRAGSYRLWQISRAGGTPRLFVAGGSQPQRPALSRDGRWLAFVEPTFSAAIWHAALPTSANKELHTEPFISSAGRDHSPEYSADGKRIAFVSDRTGTPQVWVADNDGSNVMQLSDFRGSGVGSPHWAPDDRRMVFDGVTAGLSAIWLMNDDGSSMHRLNTSSTREYMPTWSRDGHWIYYCSLKGGEDRLLKQNPDTGEIVEVNDASFYDAREDRDHGALYAERNDGRLWEIPLSGGVPAPSSGDCEQPGIPILDYRRQRSLLCESRRSILCSAKIRFNGQDHPASWPSRERGAGRHTRTVY